MMIGYKEMDEVIIIINFQMRIMDGQVPMMGAVIMGETKVATHQEIMIIDQEMMMTHYAMLIIGYAIP